MASDGRPLQSGEQFLESFSDSGPENFRQSSSVQVDHAKRPDFYTELLRKPHSHDLVRHHEQLQTGTLLRLARSPNFYILVDPLRSICRCISPRLRTGYAANLR